MMLNSTQVPNKLLDAIISGEFTERETKMLLYICRKTIGWQKEIAWVGYKLIEKDLGITKGNAWQVIGNLVKKNALVKEKKSGRNVLSLGDKWGVPKSGTSEGAKVPKSGTQRFPNRGTPSKKDNLNKITSSWTKNLLQKLEQRRGSKIVTVGPQLQALGKLKKAGLDPDTIWAKLLALEDLSDFWREHPPDYLNLANNFHRLPQQKQQQRYKKFLPKRPKP